MTDWEPDRLQSLCLAIIHTALLSGVVQIRRWRQRIFPHLVSLISFVKEEGRSHQLRIPGKTAGQGDGESGEDRMHGQRMSRGSVGDPDEIGH